MKIWKTLTSIYPDPPHTSDMYISTSASLRVLNETVDSIIVVMVTGMFNCTTVTTFLQLPCPKIDPNDSGQCDVILYCYAGSLALFLPCLLDPSNKHECGLVVRVCVP